MAKFCVVGSLNMDMVTRVDRFPEPGETLSGLSFDIFPGGKGANQAVALARLGAEVEMIGALGDDVLGDRYAAILAAEGVGAAGIARRAGVSSGTATIEVSASGENHIVVVAGANATVDPAYVESKRALIESCDALLLQLEIPMGSVLAAARMARSAGVPVILDPAPARELPPGLLPLLAALTPNETEARLLTGEDTATEEGLARAGRVLVEKGARCAILKAGARGAFVAEAAGFARVPGFPVEAIDTVAAGDSFNAGLAFALCEIDGLARALCDTKDRTTLAPADFSAGIARAVRFANAVGALSTTKRGAQSAMPTIGEARAFVAAAAPRP